MAGEREPLGAEEAETEKGEKAPESFDSFHAAEIERLTKRAEERRAQRLAPLQKRIADLREKAAAGVRANAFVESAFWKEDLLPFLQSQSARAMKPWRPGEPADTSIVEAKYFFSSGRASYNEDILAKLRQMIDDGEAAQRELDHIAKHGETR